MARRVKARRGVLRRVIKQESWCPLWHVTFECGHTRNFEIPAGPLLVHRCLECAL